MTPAITPTIGTAAPDTSRLATRENLDAAGQKFEAMFINMMLKSARQAKLGDGLFDSEALTQFREMQDAKTAETMAVHTPLGIGKALTEFLSRNQPDLKAPATPAAPEPETGK